MYKSVILITVLIFSLFTSGCERIETGEPISAGVGDEFRVNSNLSFSIDSINDYRCPVNLICIWGGDVDIYLSFCKSDEKIDTIIMLNNPAKNPVRIDGYDFRVTEVNPYPSNESPIPQSQFEIKIIILDN